MKDEPASMHPAIARLFALAGRTALITGSARGLGLEMARIFAQAGARVYLNGRDADRLASARALLAGEGLTVDTAVFDASSADACAAAVARIEERDGALDILVNNVGERFRQDMAATDPGTFARLLAVNLVGPYALERAAAPGMRDRGTGRIINVSSMAALTGRRGDPAYVAAKGGLIALTRSIAAEVAGAAVTCNALLPGAFATETNAEAVRTPAANANLMARALLSRWGAPSEIAGPALFLASDASSYMTGQLLVIDGGFTAT